MRYLLVTGHRYPKFYKANGDTVELELNYVDSKVISSIDEHGQLIKQIVSGSMSPCVDNVWLVDSIEKSLLRLESYDVYPFKDKKTARENAKRLRLQAFKYIAVP